MASVSAGKPPPGGARYRARPPPPPGHPAGAVSQSGPPSVPPPPPGKPPPIPATDSGPGHLAGICHRATLSRETRPDSGPIPSATATRATGARGHRNRDSPPGKMPPGRADSLQDTATPPATGPRLRPQYQPESHRRAGQDAGQDHPRHRATPPGLSVSPGHPQHHRRHRGHRRRKPSAARRGLSVRDSNGHRFPPPGTASTGEKRRAAPPQPGQKNAKIDRHHTKPGRPQPPKRA